MDCRFALLSSGPGSYEVRFSIDGELPIAAPFDLGLFEEERQRGILARIEQGGCDKADLLEIGTHLWNALRPAATRERLSQIRDPFTIQLDVPDELEINRLPWEALYDERLKRFLACHREQAVVRVLAERDFQLSRGVDEGPLSMLLVIPRGSGLDTEGEKQRLEEAASRLGEGRFRLFTLEDLVTAERIDQVLHQQPWDIFHFIGHSRFNAHGGGVEVRLNAERSADGEQWLDANQFAEVMAGSTVRLAVFNSCESAPSASAALAGLGKQVSQIAGVPAVVVMRFRIDNASSTNFSASFYRELLNPEYPGRVDRAMQMARRSLYTNALAGAVRSFITPVLYLASGHEEIFGRARVESLGTGLTPRAPALSKPARNVPDELIESLRANLCVPIIGPGLHASGASRDASQHEAPSLLAIVNALAHEQPEYAERGELRAAETATDLGTVLFPRVLQHYESKCQRPKLIRALRQLCLSAGPPSALRRIASWQLPGIVYTHIDGLMADALRERHRIPATINSPNRPLALGSQSALLLVNLRGTLVEPDSLVLTDSDHERLYDDLATANADIVNLFNGTYDNTFGRSVLCVGVAPIDAAVRRLARLYFRKRRGSTQGPRFFVVPHVSAGDRAYWEEFEVQWIEEDPALVIATIDEVLAGS